MIGESFILVLHITGDNAHHMPHLISHHHSVTNATLSMIGDV